MNAKLKTVTLTGADDSIDPARLIAISGEFLNSGFDVEWGILIGSQSGRQRFPSPEWMKRLLDLTRPKVKLSLHICGKHLKRIASGVGLDFIPQMHAFQRCQLNWHGEKQPSAVAGNVKRAFEGMVHWDPEVIFQLDDANNWMFVECMRTMRRTAGLFDLSHGAGVLPDEWPQHSQSPCYLGFAGGLGPDNLKEQLPKIHAAAGAGRDYWIDMESSLFDGNEFSLVRCCKVLEIVQDFIADNQ